MTLKQLIKLENKAKEVWVISPSLHYDTENKDFSEIVSVNQEESVKYRYIVPASSAVEKNLKVYKKLYKVNEDFIENNFLILPESAFAPFILESAIYNASSDCIACAAPAMEDNNDVIRFNKETSKEMAKAFKSLWRIYKRRNP